MNKETEQFVNDQGLPKNPIYITPDGKLQDEMGQCSTVLGAHDFCYMGTAVKELKPGPDAKPGDGGEIVSYNMFFCDRCLLHSYIEVGRATPEEQRKINRLKRSVGIGEGDGFGGNSGGHTIM